MNLPVNKSWKSFFAQELAQPYFKSLWAKVKLEYQTKVCYPPLPLIFNAFNLTAVDQIKVVILGQDPYHEPHQANGLAFSVQKSVPLPPSLRNIFLELKNDLHIPPASTGDLSPWAKQGVFLLNTVLTVRAHQAFSHAGYGWEIFTDHVLTYLNELPQSIVFILWGRPAQAKAKLITNSRHLILTSSHPSPLSANRSFFGSKPFSKANNFLKANHEKTINWKLPFS